MDSESCSDITKDNFPSSTEQVEGLTIEVYILLGIYLLTLVFTFYNIYAYLWK